jgi:rod shape-determining protein MreB
MLNWFYNRFSYDIGVDLGTANTLVFLKGVGVIIREPSVVAINKDSERIVAVGDEAKKMIGRTPANIIAIRPLKDGVIADFETTQRMLEYFIRKARIPGRFIPPRLVIGIPSGITEVESRAVYEACKNAGAREVYHMEEPMAAAIGAGLPVDEAFGSIIVDIGGGTTEVAVISLGGIVNSVSIRIAGDEFDESIINFAKLKYNLLIGERTSERIKIEIGSAFPLKEELSTLMQGRDLVTGLPKTVRVTSPEVREALAGRVNSIVKAVKDALEKTSPELSADVFERGIMLTGGGALLKNLDKRIAQATGIPTFLAEHPLDSVVKGTERVLEDIERLKHVLMTPIRRR